MNQEMSNFHLKPESKVRPAMSIKNPFSKKERVINLDHCDRSFIEAKKMITENRCETEARRDTLNQQYLTETNYKEFFNTQQDSKPQSTTFKDQYVEEVEKHEQTKRALNKAIQLANLLLDELQSQEKS